MNKLVAATGAVLAAGVAVVGLSLAPAAAAEPAQNPSSGCGAALVTLTNAEKAHADAVAADDAAAAAKKADDELANATDAANAARSAAVNAGVPSDNLTATDAQRLRTEQAAILAKPEPRGDADTIRLADIKRKLPLIDAFLAAQVRVTAATAAAQSNEDALRREAGLTDAAKLADDVTKASDAADKACGRTGDTVRFRNCDEVRAADKAPLFSDQPGYRVGLDADRDGIACEAVENTVAPTTIVRVPSSINTGWTP